MGKFPKNKIYSITAHGKKHLQRNFSENPLTNAEKYVIIKEKFQKGGERYVNTEKFIFNSSSK